MIGSFGTFNVTNQVLQSMEVYMYEANPFQG